MVKSRWKESMKYFGGLIDPEKDEELKKTKLGTSSLSQKPPQPLRSYLRRWNSTVESRATTPPHKAPLPPLNPYQERGLWRYPRPPQPFKTIMPERDVDDKVAKITKLLERNEDKKGGDSKKNSEVVELINDFHKQYQTLYTLYDNIKGEVIEKVHNQDLAEGTSSTTSSDSESYYSTGELSARNSPRCDNIREAFKLRSDSTAEFIELRSRLNVVTEEKEALSSENAASLRKLKESEKMISDLKAEAQRTESIKQGLIAECTQLKERLAEKESKVAARMKEMESKLNGLRLEQKKWFSEKKLLEEKISGSGKLGEENLGLLARILELQETSQGKDRAIKDLRTRDNSKLSGVKGEPDEQIVFKGNDASAQVQGIMDQVDVLQEELHSLITQRNESESNLEKVNQELSEARVQIASLKEELERKTMDFHQVLQGNEGLERKVKDFEEQMRSARNEAKSLQAEKQGLLTRISQLEESLKQTGDELSSVQTKYEDYERHSCTRIVALEGEVEKLQAEKSQMELQTEKEKQNLSDNLSSIQKKYEDLERQSSDHITALEGEVQTLHAEKSQMESRIEEEKKKLSEMEQRNAELVTKLSENELIMKHHEETIKSLQQELESLKNEKSQMESRIEEEKRKLSEMEQRNAELVTKLSENELITKHHEETIKSLQQELESLENEKSQMESQIEKEKQKLSDSLSQMEQRNAELLTKLSENESTTKHHEEAMTSLQQDFESLKHEKEKLSESAAKMEEKNNELTRKIAENQTTLKNHKETMKNLQQELESSRAEKRQLKLEIEEEKRIEKENVELRTKIEELQASIKTHEEAIEKLTSEQKQIKGNFQDSKTNLQQAEKRIEETADEFYKKFEDSLRILSRRIRVAEQLHLENKDVCNKTKAKYEKENTYLKEKIETTEVSVKKMKDITLSANDMLTGLDGLALKFEECSGNFLNRISKVSCEVLFVKDWVKRKNNTVKHVQEDINCLVTQLDNKEIEILAYREKVWKLENKVRELEKGMIHKEECLLGMEEEKREAIRQLCVWIDYHRSRSDYLKKILTDMSAVRFQRAT